MRFLSREFAGWMLLILSLFIFYRCYLLLTTTHSYVEGGALTLIGIVLFRGGIHLLKIAIAARICLETQERLEGHYDDRLTEAARRKGLRAADVGRQA